APPEARRARRTGAASRTRLRRRARPRAGSCSRRLRLRRRKRATDSDAIADEQLAAERGEQDDSLHHADEPGWKVRALQRVARVLQRSDEERDDNARKRVVARERGDDDARVPVVL